MVLGGLINGGAYIGGGFTGIEKSAIAVLIKIRFAFKGFQLSFEMSK